MLRALPSPSSPPEDPGEAWLDRDLPRIRNLLGIQRDASDEAVARCLPFSVNDATAGAENELQAVVAGPGECVDFAVSIETSNYYRNLLKRVAAGEASHHAVHALQAFLVDNPDGIWENSWVRMPFSVLSPETEAMWRRDLLSDKSNPRSPERQDTGRFIFIEKGRKWLRVPVSYLLKLALADAVHQAPAHPEIVASGMRLCRHFLNDNTSPETFSFYPAPVKRSTRLGRGVARETLKRFGFIQLLLLYAHRKFGLEENGQKPMVYFSPLPHTRQKRLNDIISDAFYRDLFMSPCLSGWDRGEDKYRYMNLCHQVLSRSQLNAIPKLKEAGVITRNLVVLPSMSNVSLANNGTHISLGSLALSRLFGDPASGFSASDEKYMGDLVIKIVEHFLPLFVGTYSAAPCRLNFWDFHPEKILGFLPHELDFTHLRMLWRRWKKKAKLKVFGHPVTPFGPEWLDRGVSRLFGLKGDYVCDFRLMDYFVALMSTDKSPALDGSPGNDVRLKRDLAEFGIFDPAMPMYLPYRLREFAKMGFSGFEGRYYSLFDDILTDMGHAASLQTLITALAYQYILTGRITHEHIPDTPFVESERRQVFFGAAVGVPTFFIHTGTANRFMNGVIKKTRRTRQSRRYPGYVRVHQTEYRRALVEKLMEDGADLIEMMGMEETLRDLMNRIEEPGVYSVHERLTRGILEEAGEKKVMSMTGEAFNTASESYYRNTLRKRHFESALDLLERDLKTLDANAVMGRDIYREALGAILGDQSATAFFDAVKPDIRAGRPDPDSLVKLIHLTILTLRRDIAYHEEV